MFLPQSCGWAKPFTSHGWTASLENLRRHSEGKPAALWMVHSGGFYTVEKQKSLRVAPGQVHWFRWEAAMTWLSGMVLMFLMYYFSSGFIDPDVADISQGRGIAIGLGVLVFGWLIYDLVVRSALWAGPNPCLRCFHLL